MDTLFVVLVVLLMLVAVAFPRLRDAFDAWRRARGERVIVCPETRGTEAVTLDAGRAARTALLGSEELRLSSCTRWPERAGCGQECLAQIHASPDGCAVRSMLEQWYAGRTCALCGRPFGKILWDHKPGLMTADREILEWPEIRPEKLPETLSRSIPICWDCTVAEGFRLHHPELVVDDPLRPAPRRDLRTGT
jgi:hypothetical protein